MVLLLFAINYSVCYGVAIDETLVMEKANLPEGLNFTVNKSCAGHAYFMQAAADELGNFAIYSRHINAKDNSDVNFKKVYIDIYDYHGEFLYEISFETPFDLAFALSTDSVDIYFYDYMLEYNLATQELSCYSFEEGAAIDNGLYAKLRSKKFTEGNWTYNYKKNINGYVGLIRSDGKQEQVLIEMPGLGNFWIKGILSGIVICTVCGIIVYRRRKRKSKNT